MDFTPDTRTDDPRVFAWLDDSPAAARDGAVVTADGVIPACGGWWNATAGSKLGLEACGVCHTRVMPNGTSIHGAQGNLNLGIPPFGLAFEHQDAVFNSRDAVWRWWNSSTGNLARRG